VLLQVSKSEKHDCFLLLQGNNLLLQVSKSEKHVCFLSLQGSSLLLLANNLLLQDCCIKPVVPRYIGKLLQNLESETNQLSF
jgi:hypothetical protein